MLRDTMPMASFRFEITSELAGSAEEVWGHAASVEGIMHELGPWLRMTLPRGIDGEAFAAALGEGSGELPARLGRSWVLLFGVLPVDWDDLVIEEIEPGRRFLERSTLLSLQRWQHERTVDPIDGGTRLSDRLEGTPRALVPARVAERVARAIFTHRHARLVERFGRVA